MAKLVRIHDPSDRQRRVPLVVQEDACPGLLEFLSKLQYGHETPLIRGIVYQWYLHHRDAGTLGDATGAVLAGPGGVQMRARGTRPPPTETVSHPDPGQMTKTAEVRAKQGTPAATSSIRAAADLPEPISADSGSAPSADQIVLLSDLDAIFQS